MSHPVAKPLPPAHYDVAIIGAGFSGSLLAVHLANAPEHPSIALIERNRDFGPGLAYGSGASSEHLLNVPAGKMGAFPDKPDHFLRWLHEHIEDVLALGIQEITPDTFLPRVLYGRYLTSLLNDAARRNDRLHLTNAEVVDIIPLAEGGFHVSFADGGSLQVEKAVLAWGNFPPTAPITTDARVIHNPWSVQAREALSKPGDILILGSGLTALDLLATAHKIGRKGNIHVLSRHGRFPQLHRPFSPHNPFLNRAAFPDTIRGLFRLVHQEVTTALAEGQDWRPVIDSLRPFTQDIWRNFSTTERRRFLRHVRPLWDIVRHRAAPQLRDIIDEFDRRKKLHRHRGRVVSVTQHGDTVEVTCRPRGSSTYQTLTVHTVINATGPESDPKRIDSRLLHNLLKRGLVKPDPLSLGVEVTGSSAGDSDPIHTVGSLRRGSLWESTAVPELRVQAAELAKVLIKNKSPALATAGTSSVASENQPDHLWLFQI